MSIIIRVHQSQKALSHDAAFLNIVRIPRINKEICKYGKMNYEDFAILLLSKISFLKKTPNPQQKYPSRL